MATYTTQKVIRLREKERRHLVIKELKATNPLYRKLLSHRYYQMDEISSTRSAPGTGKVKECIKSMTSSLQSSIFSGEDPTMEHGFLARFVQEPDAHHMSDSQAYLALGYFQTITAEDQFNIIRRILTASEEAVIFWPKAVHYLPCSYATIQPIRRAYCALRDTKLKPCETETFTHCTWRTRFTVAVMYNLQKSGGKCWLKDYILQKEPFRATQWRKKEDLISWTGPEYPSWERNSLYKESTETPVGKSSFIGQEGIIDFNAPEQDHEPRYEQL